MKCEDKYIDRISDKYNPKHVTSFSQKNAEQVFLHPLNLSLDSIPDPNFGNQRSLFTKPEEFQIFTALHFMKYKVKNSRRSKDLYTNIYLAIRNRAVSANWALVPKCIEYHNNIFFDIDTNPLMGKGHFNLINAVDCFDPWKGFKFCTYACRAILKGFMRKSRKSVFTVSIDKILLETLHKKREDENEALWVDRLNKMLKNEDLNEREKDILTYRFGCFDYTGEKLTLEEIGNMWGITKEGVRQVQLSTIDKLKNHLHRDKILH